MTKKQLIERLAKYPDSNIVVVDIPNHCSDFCAHEVLSIDEGWLPSGVISLIIKQKAVTS